MAIQSPLSGANRLTQTQLNSFLKELEKEPENVQRSELSSLASAGAARLPEGGSSAIQDAIFALTSDQYDPAAGKAKRPAPPAVDAKDVGIEQERSMDGVGVQNHISLSLEGKAAPGMRVEVVNLSRPNDPVIAQANAAANGKFEISGQNGNVFHGDVLGFRVRDDKGAYSNVTTLRPKSVEVRKWQSGTTKRYTVENKDTRSPLVQAKFITNDFLAPSKTNKSHAMVLAGKKAAVEPFSSLEVVVDNKILGKAKALEDGSFVMDAKGLTPGKAIQLRVIDPSGQVATQDYKAPALKFDAEKLTGSNQGVPYDRIKAGKPDAGGPFMQFQAEGVTDPGSEITIRNNSTGKEHKTTADENGNVNVEIGGVHQGDSLSFVAKDAAGHTAGTTLDNWAVPGEGEENPTLHKHIFGTTMLTAQVDEVIAILKAEPTSVHRGAVENFLDGDAKTVVKSPADRTRLSKALTQVFGGANDIQTNASNPVPKDPIVIGARIIKPRVMDQGSAAGLDPIEIEGKAEPFSTVSFFNASRQNAPTLGSVEADKDGNFKFVNNDERLFLHGDQIIARATDQGGGVSGDTLTKTHAYELQVWRQTGRRELVDLPHGTDTRDPFIDARKITNSSMEPISRRGKEQVFNVAGGQHTVPPNAILRVTTRSGDVFEAQANKDGSFKLDVGKFQPGEALEMHIVDVNGRTTTHNIATQPLKFDAEVFTDSSSGVPYQRFVDGKPDKDGPFLDFKTGAAVDPYAWVEVRNNSTQESFKVQADKNGAVDVNVKRVHAGDSLSFTVTDPAGNEAPGAIENHVVPGERVVSDRMLDIECQKLFLTEHVVELEQIVLADPSAANRSVLEAILEKKELFSKPADFARLKAFTDGCFGPSNDIRVHAENPAPKAPIVIASEIIKPREMEPAPRPTRARPTPPRNNWRDPLIVKGKAEPFSTIEIRNMSRPNAPVIGSVLTDKDGNFDFLSEDERLFLHGDQVMLRATDQGGATSQGKLTDTVPYEMRLWHNPPRTERVKLPIDTNTRQPFVDVRKVTQGQVPATKTMKAQTFKFTGAELAAEPNSIIRVTNKAGKEFETKVAENGSFELPVAYEPGETLKMRTFDMHGAQIENDFSTTPLKFNQDALVDSTEGAPFDRAGSKDGPFLRFAEAAVVDPFSFVTVKNNSTGKEMKVQADKDGSVDFEMGGIHRGDSLSISVADPVGNAAPQSLVNYVVPADARPTAKMSDLTAMHMLLPEHTDAVIAEMKASPTASNRGLVIKWLADDENTGNPSFKDPKDKARIEGALTAVFKGSNDVTTNQNNPAPKEPIVLDAKVIKPRVMDQGSAAGRDPLEVSGKAEPFTTVQIRNASRKNAPVIGSVQTDANGEFAFRSTDERLFLHGDQLLVDSTDQGGSKSTPALATTRAYELRIWNRDSRTETVRLSDTTDTRDPFLDTRKLDQTQVLATDKKPSTFTSFKGGPLSAPPNSVVRLTTAKGDVSEAVVKKDGSFDLDVSNYVPGETLAATITDINGRAIQQNFSTEPLRFKPESLTDPVDGPPYQKMSGGKPVEGGPFVEFKADDVAFPGAKIDVTNHATGDTQTFTADDKGGFDFELSGVHAFDLLTFEVKDAAGNPAPNQMQAWQVPAKSSSPVDPTIAALTSQRPVSPAAVKYLVAALEKNPTVNHQMLVQDLLHQHSDWFVGDAAKTLETESKRIFAGSAERVPDATNPAPQMPVVLSSEIRSVRVMDTGNAPGINPVAVEGFAEPLATVEIYNGSMPGRRLVGSVEADKDGKFTFESNDARNFMHGDNLVIQVKDAGGATSDAVVSRASAVELRVWNNSGTKRRHALESDRRPSFIQANKLTTEKSGHPNAKSSFVVAGDLGSTQVFGVVTATIGNETFETEADIEGRFRLPIKGAKVGETITLIAKDASGNDVTTNYVLNV